MINNRFRNFVTFSRSEWEKIITTKMILLNNDLIDWYNKNNCICNDIRDEISMVNDIHCKLFEQYEYDKIDFSILCYNTININGDLMNDNYKWYDFIVLYDNGKIKKYDAFELIDIDLINVATGETINKINIK